MKPKDIDLHGEFYDNIELALEKHFYSNKPPFKIIVMYGKGWLWRPSPWSSLKIWFIKILKGNHFGRCLKST